MNRTPFRRSFARRPLPALLLSASAIAIAGPAMAADVVFATERGFAAETGRRTSQTSGLTQIRLDSGAILSFVDAADYRINADGSVDLYAGSVTVAGAEGAVTVIRMPDGVEGRVGGGSAASFSVTEDGTSRGHALTGEVTIARAGSTRAFEAGEMWAANDDGLRQVVSNGAQQAPGADAEAPQVAAMDEGGPAAAAANGIPVSLPDALAFAGASSDIVLAARNVQSAVENPAIDAFPTGDLALLVSYAAQLEAPYGGQAFPGAQADVIRAYLGYLAGGGAGQNFLGAYATFLTQYLDLIRAGALPSSFQGASQADINAFIAFTGRTSGFGALSGQNRALVEAYLAFLSSGGNPDQFARSYTDLVGAYFAFLRGGGDPLAFQGASQQTLAAYIGFLSQSGLAARLSSTDRALLEAYLANGGLAFTSQYRTALNAYFAYLQAGNLPSGYAGLDGATLRNYLEALQRTGLFEQVLGAQAQFYSAFLAHMQGGGAPDAFAGLNANVFAGYATQLAAYYEFLLQGGQPSGYTALTQQQIAGYLAALQAAGASGAFLDDLSEFYAGYFAYLSGGGNPDLYTGLPSLNLPGFADALNAYAAFLAGGGLPSGYSAVDRATLAQYLDALARSGQLATLLGGNAGLIEAYFAWLANGGAVDRFAGLPVYANYVGALQAYYAFLDAGGLPAEYTALTPAQIQDYLAALAAAGGIGAQLGDLATFFTSYYAFIAGGGNPANFVGLPVYADYTAALQAYYAFLAGGGLPADYTALTQAQIQAYLAALSAAGGFSTQLGNLATFYSSYYAFIAGGGNPAEFAGLPAYANWLAALEAYYAYLGAGGLPSGYTLLTQAQIRAYIEALNGAGLLASELTADAREFILAYLAFMQTGADPDDFGELPVNNPAPTLLAGANVWIFSNEGGRVGTAPTADVAADGQIRSVGYATTPNSSVTFDYTGSGNTLMEHGRVGDAVAWTRYQRGAAAGGITNSNVHLLLGTPAVDLPASGTVDFKLIGGTAPTNAFGTLGEAGAYSGDLAVAFGSTPRVGVNFDVHVGTRGWRAQTPGGAAGAASGGLAVGGDMRFQTLDLAASGIAGNACSGYCNVQVFGGLFGSGAGSAGFEYHIDDQSGGGRSYINGTAVFGTTGTELALIGTMPGSGGGTGGGTTGPSALTGYAGGFDAVNPYVDFAIAGRINTLTFVGGEFGFQATSHSLAANGTLNSYTRNGGVTRTPGSTTVSDIFGNADALIQRWSGGTTGGSGANAVVVNANQGVHMLLTRPLLPTFVMPTTGRIDYYLIAATKPTIANGSVAPGTFAADLALLFGSTVKVAMEGQITMPGSLVYSFGTTGGMANAAASTTALTLNSPTGRFSFSMPGSDGTAACAGSACSFGVYGGFTGSDTDTIGIAYQANRATGAEGISGAAIFGAGPERTGGSGGAPAPQIATGTYNDEYLLHMAFATFDTQYHSNVTYDANGAITSWTRDNGSLNTVGQAGPVAESGSVADGIGWSRWLDTNNFASNAPNLAKTGRHLVSGPLATNLPATGTVNYELIGQTRPTDRAGNLDPGTFSGTLAVDFATRKVGFDFAVAIGDRGWTMKTTGGSANPNSGGYNVTASNGFAGSPIVTGTNAASCTASCAGTVQGALFGNGATHVGAGYTISDGSLIVSGVGAFGRP